MYVFFCNKHIAYLACTASLYPIGVRSQMSDANQGFAWLGPSDVCSRLTGQSSLFLSQRTEERDLRMKVCVNTSMLRYEV